MIHLIEKWGFNCTTSVVLYIIRLNGCQHSVWCTAEPYKHALYSGYKKEPEESYRTLDSFLRVGNVSVDGTYQRLQVPSTLNVQDSLILRLISHLVTEKCSRMLHSETFDLVVLCQAARRWLLTAETRVQSLLTSCEIHGGRSGTGAGVYTVFPCKLSSHHCSTFVYHRPTREVCDSPDQAAHYHTLGAKLGASSLTRHLASLGVKVP
jgi:hypothetical protein